MLTLAEIATRFLNCRTRDVSVAVYTDKLQILDKSKWKIVNRAWVVPASEVDSVIKTVLAHGYIPEDKQLRVVLQLLRALKRHAKQPKPMADVAAKMDIDRSALDTRLQHAPGVLTSYRINGIPWTIEDGLVCAVQPATDETIELLRRQQ